MLFSESTGALAQATGASPSWAHDASSKGSLKGGLKSSKGSKAGLKGLKGGRSVVAPVTPAAQAATADGSELAALSRRLMNLTLYEDQAP